MDQTVVQIDERTWRIEDGGVRFFLLAGTEKALLIDTGMNAANARDIAASLTDLPLSLLNTHADRDHIAGNDSFDEVYMHPAEEALYRGAGHKNAVLPVSEGDIIDLGDRPLLIIHLPGHTPGSVAALDIRARTLISGDPIQLHGRIFMFGEHRNMNDYIASMDHLMTYADRFDEIWPSHADIPVSPELITKLRDGAKAVLAGEIAGKPFDMHGRSCVAYDLGFDTLLCDH